MKLFRDWTFNWWEVGLLKLCLISLGILVALYLGEYIDGLLWLWWILFAGNSVYLIAKWLREN